MQVWEYKVVKDNYRDKWELQGVLDLFGRDGWELVNIAFEMRVSGGYTIGSSSDTWVVLKRPRVT